MHTVHGNHLTDSSRMKSFHKRYARYSNSIPDDTVQSGLPVRLQDEGIKVNRKRVVKLMRTMGLSAKSARRASKNYNRKHSNRAWANVLQQDFTQVHWNKVWLGDSTCVPTHEGYR